MLLASILLLGQLTNQMSNDRNSIAVVIPCVSNVLAKIATRDQRGISTFAQTLVDSINRRFNDIQVKKLGCGAYFFVFFVTAVVQELRIGNCARCAFQIASVYKQTVADGHGYRVDTVNDSRG